MIDKGRRQLIKKLGVSATLFLLSGIISNDAQAITGNIVYKGVTYLPPSYRGVRYGIDGFVKHLKENSPEEMEIHFFDSGTLMKADAQLSALKEGTIQFMFHSTTYISQFFPILGLTGLPGVCAPLYEHGGRIAMESPLWKLINNELAKDNLFMLSVGGGIMEPEYIWSKEKKITSLAEMDGSRCRVVGYEASEFLRDFGVIPIRIPSSQTYLALQRESVDTVLVPINTVIARNLHEQLRYCFKLPVTAVGVGLFMLKSTWDQMPKAEKEVMWQAGQWYDMHQGRMGYNKIPKEQYWPIIDSVGIQTYAPTAAEQDVFLKGAQPIWDWWIDKVGATVGRKAIDLAIGEI